MGSNTLATGLHDDCIIDKDLGLLRDFASQTLKVYEKVLHLHEEFLGRKVQGYLKKSTVLE